MDIRWEIAGGVVRGIDQDAQGEARVQYVIEPHAPECIRYIDRGGTYRQLLNPVQHKRVLESLTAWVDTQEGLDNANR